MWVEESDSTLSQDTSDMPGIASMTKVLGMTGITLSKQTSLLGMTSVTELFPLYYKDCNLLHF